MSAVAWPLILLAAAATAAAILAPLRGRARAGLGAIALLALAGGLWALLRPSPDKHAPEAGPPPTSVSSEACAACHRENYDSWHRTYHRTMTRDASPEYVKGDFRDAAYDYRGLTTRLTRDGDRFIMETVDPEWANVRALAGDRAGPPRYRRFSVDRLVGSHWVQEYMHRDPSGRYIRLPVVYHIAEKRWTHAHGAFLAPESDDFWGKSRGFSWNDTCLYCHNTSPAKNPILGRPGQVVGYDTKVAELGISCEACHGPGGEHVRRYRDAAAAKEKESDPAIVQPERLSVRRRDEICARCHGAIWPKREMWDTRSMRDPFLAGQELGRYNHFYFSEAELAILAGQRPKATKPAHPEPDDGRFWGDGTPLTTALEYTGMSLSACYQKGEGKLSCLSCHAMHTEDPNHLLKPGMRSNEACYQCHEGYRARLAEHTHHAADSPGSLCFSCHMPHQVYSLFTTHRSHRIRNPELADSVGTGKPHACNLCHLDKSLGWTREQLTKWSPRHAKAKLPAEEETTSHALLMLTRADARSRAIVAGAFSNPAAQKASGTDWFGPYLTRLLEGERYPIVRYLLHRGLKAAHGGAADPYDYLALPARRDEQARELRKRFDAAPIRRDLPHLPRTAAGLPDEEALRKLLGKRNDPDVTINE